MAAKVSPLASDAARRVAVLLQEGSHRQAIGCNERRIIHAKDATGHAILETIARRVNATSRINRRSGCVAIDLLTLSHSSQDLADKYEPLTCFGAYVLDTGTGITKAIVAKKTILATGGFGQIRGEMAEIRGEIAKLSARIDGQIPKFIWANVPIVASISGLVLAVAKFA